MKIVLCIIALVIGLSMSYLCSRIDALNDTIAEKQVILEVGSLHYDVAAIKRDSVIIYDCKVSE